MPPTASILAKAREGISSPRAFMKKLFLPILLLLGIVIFLCAAIGPLNALRAQSDNITVARTSATVDESCSNAYYSHDGNPFQLCPGPFPGGGNCVWWAWEQWHLLGYDLPLNWGNAADWIVDAERSGLSVGKEPRVGSIAVFPRADGVWAYGTPGHVAFVTSVNNDAGTFNVTYQNYGDPKPMYIGLDYPVAEINAARFQRNELRFIYFPTTIDPTRFAQLPGLHGNYIDGIIAANQQMRDTAGASNPKVSLNGNGSTEQEFNADFTGNGTSDLLLYNRKQGSLSILSLTTQKSTTPKRTEQGYAQYAPVLTPQAKRVKLSDSETSTTGWGSDLDVRVGNFAGTKQSNILLYDRSSGTIQILTLTPQLKIQKHVSLAGWGPNWELYTGRFDGQRTGLFLYNRSSTTNTSLTNNAQTGTALQRWQMTGRTANAAILDFNADLSIRHMQQYTQWHDSWEVYVGRYKNTNQDGVFLYDRNIGEARIMDFNASMVINDYQELHNLKGNWQVFSGDFNGSGRAQVMLYDPSKGTSSFLVLGSDLSLVKRQNYTGWTQNGVLYVGHFGMDRLNVMLYDPQAGTSTFIAFNDKLKIQTKHTVHSWGKNYQILVGSFVDRSLCIANGNCSKGDDILVLNRKTGQIQQYIFSFGRQYQVINNTARPFTRGSSQAYKTIDTTTFKVVGTFNTSIKTEELY